MKIIYFLPDLASCAGCRFESVELNLVIRCRGIMPLGGAGLAVITPGRLVGG